MAGFTSAEAGQLLALLLRAPHPALRFAAVYGFMLLEDHRDYAVVKLERVERTDPDRDVRQAADIVLSFLRAAQ